MEGVAAACPAARTSAAASGSSTSRGCAEYPGKAVQLPGSLTSEREGPGALDGLARAGVVRSLRLELRQHPLGTLGSPEFDEAAIFVAQGHLVGLAILGRTHTPP